jgi:DNA-binding IclR family transcriptional regulator
VPAVSRAIAILKLLGGSSEPMGLQAIARALDLVPSTGLHILRVLVAEELVKVDAGTKRYSLGSGMISLARSAIQNNDFAGLSQPLLDRITQTWGTTTMGVEITALKHMVVVALSRSQAPFRLHVDVGARFHSLDSASGRLVAAFGGETWPQLERKFKAIHWERPISKEEWKREVDLARQTGVAVDRDNYISGVIVVAVPLLDPKGGITHALASAGLSSNLDDASVRSIAADLRAAADELSAVLSLPR